MSRPWYKWFPGDYLKATLGLSLEEDAYYRRALDAMWMNDGYIPRDPKKLSLLLRVGTRKVSILEPSLSTLCRKVETGIEGVLEPSWTQDRLLKELEVYKRKCAKNAENAKKGAEARWTQDAERHSERHSENMPNGTSINMANGIPENALIQKPETRSQKKEKEKIYKKESTPPVELIAKTKFNEARQAYGGIKRGLDTEWDNFKKKNKDYRATVHKLFPAIQRELDWKMRGEQLGAFIPLWPHFQVWINQRRWEQELPEHTIQSKDNGGDDVRLKELMSRQG